MTTILGIILFYFGFTLAFRSMRNIARLTDALEQCRGEISKICYEQYKSLQTAYNKGGVKAALDTKTFNKSWLRVLKGGVSNLHTLLAYDSDTYISLYNRETKPTKKEAREMMDRAKVVYLKYLSNTLEQILLKYNRSFRNRANKAICKRNSRLLLKGWRRRNKELGNTLDKVRVYIVN